MVTLLTDRSSFSRIDREGDVIDLPEPEALRLIGAGSALPWDRGDTRETQTRRAPETTNQFSKKPREKR